MNGETVYFMLRGRDGVLRPSVGKIVTRLEDYYNVDIGNGLLRQLVHRDHIRFLDHYLKGSSARG